MTSPLPHFDDPVAAAQWGVYAQEQRDEYGTYVAAQNIPVGSVLAFLAGQPVPRSTAEREGWVASGLVVPVADAPKVADRAQEIRARRAALDAENARLDAELAAIEAVDEPAGPDEPDEDADTDVDDEGDGYDGMTVEQLKTKLAERGLPTSGTKPELITRLRAADTEE